MGSRFGRGVFMAYCALPPADLFVARPNHVQPCGCCRSDSRSLRKSLQGCGQFPWGIFAAYLDLPDCLARSLQPAALVDAPQATRSSHRTGNDGEEPRRSVAVERSEEHTSELQSLRHLVCRL